MLMFMIGHLHNLNSCYFFSSNFLLISSSRFWIAWKIICLFTCGAAYNKFGYYIKITDSSVSKFGYYEQFLAHIFTLYMQEPLSLLLIRRTLRDLGMTFLSQTSSQICVDGLSRHW